MIQSKSKFHKGAPARLESTIMTEPANGRAEETKAILSREEYFKGFLDHLSIPFLKPITEGFFENIRRVESLIEMPFLMFSMLEIERQSSEHYRSMALDYWSRGEGIRTFRAEYIKTLTLDPNKATKAKDPDFRERVLKKHDEILAIPNFGEPLRQSMQVLYSAGVSGSWTALECLATDLWVTALNEEPLTLAQTAISSLEGQEPGELTSKQIPVGLAARHGFDLRHCLGTVLRPKFDFTGVSGIQKAYKVFAPNDGFIEEVLAQPELSDLEATRHVIVHRAGKVDEEYRRRTDSNLPVGEILTFSYEQSSKFSYVAAHAGTGLLAFVDEWLVKRKAQGKGVKT